MKTIFNFRPLFTIFLGFILGAIYYLSITNLVLSNWLGFFIGVTILLGFLLLYIVFGCINLKGKFFNFLNRTYKVAILLLVSICLFAGIFKVADTIKQKQLVDISEVVEYTGKITDVKISDNTIRLELKNVKYKIDNKSYKLHSHLNVYVFSFAGISYDNLKVGNYIKSSGNIDKTEISSYAYFNYDSLYSTNSYYNNLTISNGKPSIFESFKLKVNSFLNKYMSEDVANISYAMILGDKEGIDTKIVNVFSLAGISHIICVSGLHIGVLCAFLQFILKKLKCKNVLVFVTLFLILLSYSILCNFTPSVLRASIMSMVLVTSNIFGLRYDALSSLSFAGVLILLLNPFELFSVGFQLSFACVFAIITLAPLFIRMLTKLRLNKKFAEAFSISIAISLALIPFTAYYFHKISVLSVFTNIIVIPLFSLSYLLLFPITIVGLILDFVGYLLIIPSVLIHFIKLIANFVVGLKFSNIKIFNVSVLTLALILFIQYIIQFMVGVPKFKFVLVVLLLCGFISMFFGTTATETYDFSGVICFKQYYNNTVIALNTNSDVALIGLDADDNTRLVDTLLYFRIAKIKAIFLYQKINDVEYINNFVKEYDVENVYIPQIYYSNKIKNAKIVNKDDIIEVGKTKYSYLYQDDVILGLNLIRRGKNNLILNEIAKSDLVYLSNILDGDIYMVLLNNLSFDINEFLDYNWLVTQNNDNNTSDYNLNDKDQNLVGFMI